MAISNAVTLANLSSGETLIVDSENNRVGIASTNPTQTLDVGGVIKAEGLSIGNTSSGSGSINLDGSISVGGSVTANEFYGDGTNLTGISGFATPLSTDQTSPLNVFFKTPQQVNIGAGTSLTIESDATSGNVAFIREGIVHVAVGATFHIKTNNTLVTNVLGVF